MALIVEYLSHLARNPDACKSFREDPAHAMQCFGLSADQQKAVLCGDAETLGTAMQNEFGGCADVVASMTTKVVPPR